MQDILALRLQRLDRHNAGGAGGDCGGETGRDAGGAGVNETIDELTAIIESFRQKEHDYVDEDCWYSCPAHPDYCGEQARECLCGMDARNAKVDRALELIRTLEA